MSGFSSYLHDFMKMNAVSTVDLSRETDIDRTVLYRYIKGSRIPSEQRLVLRIADGLQMTASEKEKLLEEYDKLSLGENLVYSYQCVSSLLQSLTRQKKNVCHKTKQWQTIRDFGMNASVIRLKSREEIIVYIMDLVQYIMQRKADSLKIYLVMQPMYEELQQFFFYICHQGKNAIEQVVCLEKNINRRYLNIPILENILPLYFEGKKYQIRYYYDSLESHINNMSNMPNYIILQDYVIQFDYNMEHGVVVKDAAYTDAMLKQYKKVRSNARPLFLNNLEVAYPDFFMQVKEMGQKNFSLSWMGGICLNSKVLENLSNFSEKGKLAVKYMIALGKTGHVSYRFVPDEANLPESIHLFWQEEEKYIVIGQMIEGKEAKVVIEEPSIYRTFQCYMEYLEKKGLLYNGEESLHYLEKLLA